MPAKEKRRIEKRKTESHHYIVLKPLRDCFHQNGRRYNEKGIATLVHQGQYDFEYESIELRREILQLITKRMEERIERRNLACIASAD